MWDTNTTNVQCIISTTHPPFARHTKKNYKTVVNHGVKKRGMKGILLFMTQEEYKSKKANIQANGLANAEVLKWDPK